MVVVHGPGGIGKTALLQYWHRTRSRARSVGWISTTPLWFSAGPFEDPGPQLNGFIEQLYADRSEARKPERDWVVLDDIEYLTDDELRSAASRLLNLKRVQSVVILSRRRPELSRAEYLDLARFDPAESASLLKRLLDRSLSGKEMSATIEATQGMPEAISMLAHLLQNGHGQSVLDLLGQAADPAPVEIFRPDSQIIQAIAPKIISLEQALIEKLRANPRAMYDLSPRRFEELIAELFSGMGARVELTPATRDGGKDILVYSKTEVGEMLCLVDAKRYREDRKVGVGLVRELYGTLCDYQANSAMLVTTSSFSKDAHEFQEKHQYQLALRDYRHVVEWLQKHKN